MTFAVCKATFKEFLPYIFIELLNGFLNPATLLFLHYIKHCKIKGTERGYFRTRKRLSLYVSAFLQTGSKKGSIEKLIFYLVFKEAIPEAKYPPIKLQLKPGIKPEELFSVT